MFQDSSARRYYETPRRANEAKVALSSPPRGPASDAMAALDTAVADLVDSSSPEKRVAGGSQPGPAPSSAFLQGQERGPR